MTCKILLYGNTNVGWFSLFG